MQYSVAHVSRYPFSCLNHVSSFVIPYVFEREHDEWMPYGPRPTPTWRGRSADGYIIYMKTEMAELFSSSVIFGRRVGVGVLSAFRVEPRSLAPGNVPNSVEFGPSSRVGINEVGG